MSGMSHRRRRLTIPCPEREVSVDASRSVGEELTGTIMYSAKVTATNVKFQSLPLLVLFGASSGLSSSARTESAFRGSTTARGANASRGFFATLSTFCHATFLPALRHLSSSAS